MKRNLTDTTFIIPLWLDSVVRLENLVSVVRFIRKEFFCNIMVRETGRMDNGVVKKMLGRGVDNTFTEDHDPVFHRTRIINRAVCSCATPLIAVWDSDVIIDPASIEQAALWLRDSKADFVLPYDGEVVDTTDAIRDIFYGKPDFGLLSRHKNKMHHIYGRGEIFGGAFMCDRRKYMDAGMENENFYGWGHEDFERKARWDKLGYRTLRTGGVLYHLSHPRSEVNNKFGKTHTRAITESILKMTEEADPESIPDLLKTFRIFYE